MEWLVTGDGRYIPLTATQSRLLDACAAFEDLLLAHEDLLDVIAASRSLVADSRRWRRIRQSGLRSISSRK